MKKTWIAQALAIGAFLGLLGGNAFAGPIEISEYIDKQSGDRFELYQKRDGSYFCSVERANGTLSGFDVQSHPTAFKAREGAAVIMELAETYYKNILRKKARSTDGSRSDSTGCSSGRTMNADQDGPSYRETDCIRNHTPNGNYFEGRLHALCSEAGKGLSNSRKVIGLILFLMASEQGSSLFSSETNTY